MTNQFLWGAAISSHQVEGNNIHNDWWAWEQKGHIEGGAQSGQACHFRDLWKEDLQRAKDLNLNSFRFSIEWSRLQPKQDYWDEKELLWYKEVLEECLRLELVPLVTLHHFSLPFWLAEKGAWLNDDISLYFSKYVEKVVSLYGDYVSYWCTLNEPMVHAIGSYVGEFMPPAKTSLNDFSKATYNMMKAHSLAYNLIHSLMLSKGKKVFVGLAHNMMWFKPSRRRNIFDHIFAAIAHRIYNKLWLDFVSGKPRSFYFPGIMHLKSYSTNKREILVDFIGINYYTKALIEAWPKIFHAGNRIAKFPVGVYFSRRRDAQSDLAWAIYPKGFYRCIKIAAKYGFPLIITENGIADREDKLRPDFLKSHLNVINQSLEEGLDIRGYFHWSLIDNFEWIKGFWPRFGLYSINYETQERILTASGMFYKNYIEINSVKKTKP